MTFTSSSSPDITEAMPAGLSQDASASANLKRGGVRWDISIAGVGFVLGINDQNPYIRESQPVQKEQIDTSGEAGEQTLDGLWIRSQTSWHKGAGINFYEPGSRDQDATPSRYRFATSAGVDVWSEGDLRLLKKMTQARAATTDRTYVASARLNGADVYFSQVDSVLRRVDATGTATSYTPTAAAPSGRIAIAGSKVLVGADSFGIDVGDVSGNTLTRLYNQALGTTPQPYWAKGRIIAARGRDLFELALDGTSGTTAGNLDTVTALFTHPDAGWKWTAVTESPDAILAAGYANGVSAVYAFTLESNTGGATPKLGQPFQVAEFPPGEEVHALRVYLGTYLGIGTSKGLRVGIVGDTGRIQYGPLLFETTEPVRALGARDAYLYAGVSLAIDGKSGCARVDLGNPIGNSLIFPWAWDAQTHSTGKVRSLAFVGHSDRVVIAAETDGVYVQSATAYEDSGYLTSGAIRYGTTELKAFRFCDVRCTTDSASAVALSALTPGGSEVPLVTLSQNKEGTNLSLANLVQKLEYLSYKLTLRPSADTLTSPVVQSVAFKAVPYVRKQRLIKYPVMFQEKQVDGMKVPFQENVAEKIAAIENAESNSAVVQVVDYRLDESFPAVIESFRFTGSTPSTGSKRGGNNVGGRGEITVRRL